MCECTENLNLEPVREWCFLLFHYTINEGYFNGKHPYFMSRFVFVSATNCLQQKFGQYAIADIDPLSGQPDIIAFLR